jgi:uncharacterized protein YdeI (YjbR/CyaY-like superfamily)
VDDEGLAFESPAAFEAWLDEHHESSDGIWIRFAKKSSGIASVTYKEVLPIALAYGWIDGQVKRIDEDWYRQRWTPRRARSVWSKINRTAAEAMIERGEMKPAGLREVERAKADGRWERAYDSPKTAEVPEDLRAALDADVAARGHWDAFPRSTKRAILEWIQAAKRPETRARRVATTAAEAAAGRRANQWR